MGAPQWLPAHEYGGRSHRLLGHGYATEAALTARDDTFTRLLTANSDTVVPEGG